MREIFLVCCTCVIGWGISAGVSAHREVAEWAAIDASAKHQAELSLAGLSNDSIGVEVSPAIK